MENKLLCLALLALCCTMLPTSQAVSMEQIVGSRENIDRVMIYMKKYDYMDKSMNSERVQSLVNPDDLQDTIRRMQLYMGVAQTGILDADTMAMLDKGRCGVSDPTGVANDGKLSLGGRLKRYAHTGSKWTKTDLTYLIVNSARRLTMDQVRTDLAAAFKVWSDVTPLTFREIKSGTPDIFISFGRYYHEDPYPFDGPNGVLAHAFPPQGGNYPLEGDVHFDDDEDFTINVPDGINLFTVAAHEIGHSLGLSHSSVSGALMAPFYQGYDPDWTLPYDDQLGIQLLYGGPVTRGDGGKDTPTKTDAPIKPSGPDTCNIPYDAVAYIRREVFAFKDDHYSRVLEFGYPITPEGGYETQYFWPNVPAVIDAVYERRIDHQILFFSGDQYWAFYGTVPTPGYPKPISDLSPDLPSNIDAVLTYVEWDKTYFFKGNLVYRYDERTKSVDPNWPYEISKVFPGIPSDLSGAFRVSSGDEKYSIFVKGTKYYYYNDMTYVPDGYPKEFGEDFFGCAPSQIELDGENDDGNGANGVTVSAVGVMVAVFAAFMNLN